ncbi:MAG: hypothetical protein PHR61_04375 [Candidatus Absconditabacteria bacterium]|nr:hypothetical protein [Candidatus Absconditabacteria bacterium]
MVKNISAEYSNALSCIDLLNYIVEKQENSLNEATIQEIQANIIDTLNSKKETRYNHSITFLKRGITSLVENELYKNNILNFLDDLNGSKK